MSAAPRPQSRTSPGFGRSGARVRVGASLLAVAALAAVWPAAIAGQLPGCRCVDEGGNEIEGCRCEMALPDVPSMAPLPPAAPVPPAVLAWSMAGERRARLGVTLGTPERDGEGAPVEDVMEDGPADRAGLQPGDRIVALAGHDLSEPVEREREGRVRMRGDRTVPRLLEILADLEPGEEVELAYVRDGERRTTTITPEETPSWARFRAPRSPGSGHAGPRVFAWGAPDADVRVHADGSWVFGSGRCPGEQRRAFSFGRSCVAGAELVELNPSLGEYFGADEGVLVPDADEDSPLGLRAGDVLLAIDGREVASPDDVRRILGSYADGEELTLRVLRRGEAMDVRGRMER